MKKTPQFDRFFAAATCLVLLLCFLYCIVFSDDINSYENRPANKVPPFSAAEFLAGTYQDSLEDALMDQMPLSETLKRFFNNTSTTLLALIMDPILESGPRQYVSFRGLQFFGGDYLCYQTKTPADLQPAMDNRIAELNETIRNNPDVTFYLYYIECDVDIDFETGERTGIWESLSAGMDLPSQQMARLEVPDFATYSRYFFRTDHHWNHVGAYEGYRQTAGLMGIPEEELLIPLETLTVEQPLIGTKANSIGANVLNEPFHAYRFDLPAVQTRVNGDPNRTYGSAYEDYIGKTQGLSYAAYYGFDEGEVIFDTGRKDLDNLLILGNSYDNALIRNLSCHFGKTCAVDLRYYEAHLGREFDFASYLREQEIDRVLLIGDNSYFSGNLFMMGGE